MGSWKIMEIFSRIPLLSLVPDFLTCLSVKRACSPEVTFPGGVGRSPMMVMAVDCLTRSCLPHKSQRFFGFPGLSSCYLQHIQFRLLFYIATLTSLISTIFPFFFSRSAPPFISFSVSDQAHLLSRLPEGSGERTSDNDGKTWEHGRSTHIL